MKPQPNGVLRFNILQHARAPMFSLIRCNDVWNVNICQQALASRLACAAAIASQTPVLSSSSDAIFEALRLLSPASLAAAMACEALTLTNKPVPPRWLRGYKF